MPKYIVFPNNEIRRGGKRDPISKTIVEEAKIYKAGDEIELSKEEAETMKHAVGTPSEAKKAEALDEARKLLEEEERQKAETGKGKGK